MELRNKRILLISPESWGINFVSKHHYALELSKNNEVYFLNPPSSKHGLRSISNNLWVIDYKPKFFGLGKMPGFLSSILTKIEITSIEKRHSTKFEIIWNFDSSRFFNLAKLNSKFKIAHLVDLSEKFQRPLLCKTADICLCTTQHIAHKMQLFSENVFNIGHGVALNENVHLLDDDIKVSEILRNHKIWGGYVGNLSSKYLDWDMILRIVKNNPDIGFLFIGSFGKSNLTPGNESLPQLLETRQLKNAYFIGEVSSSAIIPILKQLDVLLLVYKSSEFREQLANPHKLLEYLATGKVVLASWTEEYEKNQDLLEMYASNKELCDGFKKIVSNLELYNSKEKATLRKSFASKRTYENKIMEIETMINNL